MRLFSDASSAIADPWLRRAYRLAENGRGTTSPNPLVGCVIVRGGEVVGEGWHERAGGPHAEVVALAQAGERARGADVYVTLEPCNHTGRTGPCTVALLDAGVASVHIGMRDPNPAVEGGGGPGLARSGADVSYATDPAPFEEQNEAWVKYVATGLPWVQVKTALTLDGHASLTPGVRSQLTGPGAAALTMRLRTAADAVVVGSVTLAVDDPALTVRDVDGLAAKRQPLRVVLCREHLPSPGARLFTDGLGPALVLAADDAPVSAKDALRAAGIAVETYAAVGGVEAALAALGERGVTRVLVEAGPGLFEALLAARAVDEFVLYHAGVCAGEAAPPLAHRPRSDRMRPCEAGIADGDAVTVWRRPL